ncbi:MAG: hypothetical protein JW708_08095 [Vallitaleaceae bacterium]|jgi:hypothetical protein|nr:hypothetical protein [Vallitaleaceae bacterium]
MKTIAKPIEMISWTEASGKIHPIRFKIENKEGERIVYKIEKIYTSELEKIAGNRIYKFTCEINLSGTNRICELRYELDSCKWILFKL